MTDQDLDLLLDRWDAPEASPTMRSSLRAAIPARPRRKLFGVVPLRWALAGLAGAAGVAVAAGVVSRQPVISSGSGQLEGGVYYRSSMRVAPALAIWKWFQLGTCGGGRGVNILYNHDAQTYVGYEMEISSLGNGQYLMSPKPLTRTLSQLTPLAVGSYRQVASPPLPASRIVRVGEAFDVDLIVVPEKDERVFSRIELSAAPFGKPSWRDAPPEQQRFAGMMLELSAPKLYQNGALIAEAPNAGQGGSVWFYLPDRGRYLMSLTNSGNLNFAEAGVLRGNTIEFQVGGESFQLTGVQSVNGGGDRAVYVCHEQSFHLNPDHPLSKRPLFGTAGLPMLLK
ncbi:MAG: hypothetical protein LLG20_06630 [Acidobacteriales bacterium]|nr:hypothetical protein [Terriglobales bacterium]